MKCIYHSIDLDGWMSAAIVKTKYPEAELIGYNHGEELPIIPAGERVIMVDMSFPIGMMEDMVLENGLIWIDHHISAIEAAKDSAFTYDCAGLRDPNFAACELTWKYFHPNLNVPEVITLLGKYDSFRHKGTPEEKYVLEFQYGARQAISSPESAMKALDLFFDDSSYVSSIHQMGSAIYAYLCTEAKQIYARRANVKIGGYLFAMVNQDRFNPINFGINYHRDGYDGAGCFVYRPDSQKWVFSLYNDDGSVDVSKIATSMGGGGHKGAAGFTMGLMGLSNILGQ